MRYSHNLCANKNNSALRSNSYNVTIRMNSTEYGKRTQAFVTQFFSHSGNWLFPYKEKYHNKNAYVFVPCMFRLRPNRL